jgi:hypothetical protein
LEWQFTAEVILGDTDFIAPLSVDWSISAALVDGCANLALVTPVGSGVFTTVSIFTDTYKQLLEI